MSSEAPTFIGASDDSAPSTSAVLDIVFVHCLNGNRHTTWSETQENFWLRWLAEQFPNCNIYTAGYDTDLFYNALTGPGASIQDLATVLADALISRIHTAPSLMLVTHSLGGLIVKQMIRKCTDSADVGFNDVARSIRAIAFLGTPHQGARFSEALNIVLKNFKSQVVQQLAHSSDNLIDLHEFFRSWATKNSVIVKPYYETEYTWGVHVVDKVTANPNVFGADPIAVQADHIQICKPTSRTSPVYASISKVVETLIAKSPAGQTSRSTGKSLVVAEPSSSTLVTTGEGLVPVRIDPAIPGREAPPPNSAELTAPCEGIDVDILTDYQFYTTPAEADRRDLAQKLIDVGRAYQVTDAERKKERFSMALRRNIAQPAAVTRYTKLMADVESRYNRHIARLIFAGADGSVIDHAIQNEIVEPCAVTHSTVGHEISASLVDSALYYLAGNCHIRWDDDTA